MKEFKVIPIYHSYGRFHAPGFQDYAICVTTVLIAEPGSLRGIRFGSRHQQMIDEGKDGDMFVIAKDLEDAVKQLRDYAKIQLKNKEVAI